jgi:hypothetical protein
MGRSVSFASGATCVVFLNPGLGDERSEEWTWYEFIDDVRNVVREKYRSFAEEDRWIEREVRSILVNRYARVAVAEYGGLVSISLVPTDDALAESWCATIADAFKQHIHKRYPDSSLVKLGTFSNGESVYVRAGS